jgi:hypothetical protein
MNGLLSDLLYGVVHPTSRSLGAANDAVNLSTLLQPVKRGIDSLAASEVQEVSG